MAKWMKPGEQMPEVSAGDRVAIIVVERLRPQSKKVARLVVIEATETGWHCEDDTYSGYTIYDGVLWSLESDLCGIAEIVAPEAFQ